MSYPVANAHEEIVRDGKGWTVLSWGQTELNANGEPKTPFYVPIKSAPTRLAAIAGLKHWIKRGRKRG